MTEFCALSHAESARHVAQTPAIFTHKSDGVRLTDIEIWLQIEHKVLFYEASCLEPYRRF